MREQMRERAAVRRAFRLVRVAYAGKLCDARGAVNALHAYVGDPDAALLPDAAAWLALSTLPMSRSEGKFLDALGVELIRSGIIT